MDGSSTKWGRGDAGSGVTEAGLGSGKEEQRLWRASLLEVEEGRDTEAALGAGGDTLDWDPWLEGGEGRESLMGLGDSGLRAPCAGLASGCGGALLESWLPLFLPLSLYLVLPQFLAHWMAPKAQNLFHASGNPCIHFVPLGFSLLPRSSQDLRLNSFKLHQSTCCFPRCLVGLAVVGTSVQTSCAAAQGWE